MKNIDLKKLSDAEHTVISDWETLGAWRVENRDGVEIDFAVEDLQIDEKGNIYKPTDFYYKNNSYSDADTGHNTVEDIDFEWTAYDVMITREELKAKLLEYLKEDADMYLTIADVHPDRVNAKHFITFLKDFKSYLN